jgi:tetratricopeptide (TPR) repeat protein
MSTIELSEDVVAAQCLQTGIAYFRRNQFHEAITAFEAALRLKPEDPYARWNRATALLSLGDYERGFKEHDWAWRLFNWTGTSSIGDTGALQALPLWRGESDARLLVYHELGFGDAIMAMRFLPELKKRANITLVIDEPLVRLAQHFDVEIVTTVPYISGNFDYRLPFFGVMSALQQTVETIPAEPYIPASWSYDGAGRVGIAWSGRTQTMFSLEKFTSLLSFKNFGLYSLQPSGGNAEVVWLPQNGDFMDVANRIAEMDHIVTVDTAAAHLAGAMGHPSVHLLLPFLSDWRWWRTATWYPNVKTYRQETPDDWLTPFALLNHAVVSEHKMLAYFATAET